MPRQDPTQLVGAWRDLLARHAKVSDALERELQRRHGLSVTEFEALQRLAERSADGCRLLELAGDVPVSRSALSRVISRLEDRGLVARRACEDDRRGIYACLTPAGVALLRAAAPTQHEVLARELAA